jgi:hypothetical protein
MDDESIPDTRELPSARTCARLGRVERRNMRRQIAVASILEERGEEGESRERRAIQTDSGTNETSLVARTAELQGRAKRDRYISEQLIY